MKVTLDGHFLFDEQGLEIQPGSFNRASMERNVPGLNGVLSIDLGQRSKEIKQKGVLQAKSRALLDKRIAAVSAFIDGDTHKLVTETGGQFNNLRMDTFKLYNESISGAGISVDYEIVYTQLV